MESGTSTTVLKLGCSPPKHLPNTSFDEQQTPRHGPAKHRQYLCLLSFCHTRWVHLHIMNIHKPWNLQ